MDGAQRLPKNGTQVVVVGGGVMGLATAWRLALTGVETRLVERFEVGHDNGSSHGPTRVFRFLYHDPLYVWMAQASLPFWRTLEDASGASLLRMTGGLYVDAPELVELHRAAMTSCGAVAEILPSDERRARFPWLDTDGDGLYVPDVGVLAADPALAAMHELACAAGVEVNMFAPVQAIEPRGDGVRVVTSNGAIDASTCVVAAGAWVNDVLGPLDIRVPVRVTREQVLYFDGAPDEVVPFVHGVGHWIYAVPPFVAGPFKVAEHGTGAETNADERGFELDAAGAERVTDYVRETLPSLDPEPVGFETCLYTSAPGDDFVVDRRGPIVVLSPCSGHGFKFAPLIGEIAACLATDRPPPFDIGRFSLDRFS